MIKKISILNKNIPYELIGDREELMMFVHGWGGSKESMRNLAHRASQHYTCLIFDLPGFGNSDPPDPDWGVGEYATCVQHLIETIGKNYSAVHYFGHSFGGSLGIYLAAHKMVEMKTLMLCCSSYKRRKVASSRYIKIKSMLKRYLPFFETISKPLILPLYRLLFPRSDISRFPHLETNFRKIVTQDLSDLPSHIQIQTLIIGAEKDTATPIELAQELHKKIKKSKLVIIPDATHGLPLKQPDVVWEEIKKYMI